MRMTIEQLEAYANAEFGGPAIGAWPRNKGEKLRPHKGGGGGGGDGGAGAREAERQQRIRAATDEINRIFNNKVKQTGTRYVNESGQAISPEEYNAKKAAYDAAMKANPPQRGNPFSSFGLGMFGDGMFNQEDAAPSSPGVEDPSAWSPQSYEYWADGDPNNSRDAMYSQQKKAVYDLNKMEVDRQAKEAERTNRFALARTGLLGGSADVEAASELNRRTNEGLLRAGGIADQSAADLKVADERTRSNLISMAQSGIDTGTAATMALEGLKGNSAQAAAARSGATVGGLFNDLSQAYLINQQLAGRNSANAAMAGQQWYGVSSPQTTYSGKTTN